MKSKKEIIIETATSLFAEQGFEKTSVATICQTANVSKGLVYHHFKSKEEILIAVYELATEKMVGMNNSTSKKPAKQIKDLIEIVFTQLVENKSFFQLNLNIMFQPSTSKILETQIKERANQLYNSVKHIFDQLSKDKSEILSHVFISEIDGIAFGYLSSFENYPIEEMKKQLLKKYSNDSKI